MSTPKRELVVIHNVDVELLDRQRLALVRITDDLENCRRPEPEDMELIAGLQNMLDAWSDDRYHAGTVSNIKPPTP